MRSKIQKMSSVRSNECEDLAKLFECTPDKRERERERKREIFFLFNDFEEKERRGIVIDRIRVSSCANIDICVFCFLAKIKTPLFVQHVCSKKRKVF